MGKEEPPQGIRALVTQFRTSEHWAVSLVRDILWVVAVVVGIALLLFLICGTWPAIVAVESGSMEPHMNIGDLVIVVQKDRFGELQTWDTAHQTNYTKFGDYGDVIIYRPNGETDFWASIGLLPLSSQTPIIHRAMTWVDAGQPEPSYLNIYRGGATPLDYVPLATSNETLAGSLVLYPEGSTLPANLTSSPHDIVIRTQNTSYLIPSAYVLPGAGFIQYPGNITTHGGYITKGDNNPASDQGYLTVPGTGTIEPVEQDWVIGKALFVIPVVGLLPLHIAEVVVVLVVIWLVYEWHLRRQEAHAAADNSKPSKKSRKKKR
jgi:signal peptidase